MPPGKVKGTADPNAEPVSMESLTRLLESHRAAISEDFRQSISSFETKFNGVLTTVNEHSERLAILESGEDSREERLKGVEEAVARLRTENNKITNKLIDLESRSRRNNIRVIGIPESIEGPQSTAFCAQILYEVFGGLLDSSVECERAHRSLAPKPPPNQRPRLIIIRLLRFQVKDKIIRHVRAMRGKLKFRSHSILVFEDYPPPVVKQRAAYKVVMSKLYEHGLKPALLYPARLYVKLQSGERKYLPSVVEAEAFIASLPPL